MDQETLRDRVNNGSPAIQNYWAGTSDGSRRDWEELAESVGIDKAFAKLEEYCTIAQ